MSQWRITDLEKRAGLSPGPGRDATQRQFTDAVCALARQQRWQAAQLLPDGTPTTDSGFPQLCLIRGRRLLFLTLLDEQHQLTKNQRRWLRAINNTSHVEAGSFMPSHWHEIETILK